MLQKKIILHSIFFFVWMNIIAQTGKDGPLVLTSIGNIVNKYCPVSSNIVSGTSSLVVTTSNLLSLCPGDLIMVYQAQGATINTVNTNSYGDITAYNSAGLYEFKYVHSINGNTITTQNTFTNSYAVGGRVQVIKVPQYTTLTISTGASIEAKLWKDTAISGVFYRFGGLVAIHASNIVNNGLISANGSGFRGGALVNDLGINTGANSLRSNLSSEGAEKGEGIAGFQTDYDLVGGRYCMGAAANAGGAGNNHNAGGGGGGNGDNGNLWTGQGVMIVNANNPHAAWSLSAAYTNNSNSLTNSSGGGRGGYSWGDANANALIDPPGNWVWIGDSRREVGGLGGRPLTNINAETRIYFGGGGGAPHQNNNSSSPGSSGGGIVYLISNNAITGTGSIQSRGNTAGNATGCSCDGAPGAGAGGTIVLKTPSVALTINIIATGGNGGNQLALNFPGNPFDESEGPGGGGGGGFVALPLNAPIPQINGGQNGISLSGAVTEMNFNGSTQGGSGQISTVTSSFITYTPTPNSVSSITISSTDSIVCFGNSAILSISVAGNYTWQPGNINSNQIVATPTNITIYSVSGTNMYGCKVEGTYSLSVSECVELNTIIKNKKDEISIFPNPTSGKFYLELRDNKNLNFIILNSLGQPIKNFDSDYLQKNLFEIDLSAFANGIYFIKIGSQNLNVNRKLIIDK